MSERLQPGGSDREDWVSSLAKLWIGTELAVIEMCWCQDRYRFPPRVGLSVMFLGMHLV